MPLDTATPNAISGRRQRPRADCRRVDRDGLAAQSDAEHRPMVHALLSTKEEHSGPGGRVLASASARFGVYVY